MVKSRRVVCMAIVLLAGGFLMSGCGSLVDKFSHRFSGSHRSNAPTVAAPTSSTKDDASLKRPVCAVYKSSGAGVNDSVFRYEDSVRSKIVIPEYARQVAEYADSFVSRIDQALLDDAPSGFKKLVGRVVSTGREYVDRVRSQDVSYATLSAGDAFQSALSDLNSACIAVF